MARYDFGVVAASPIAFPIEWHNSKIPGFTLRVSVPNYHGFTALVVMSSVAARFFPPQVGGVPFLPAPAVFRIDHDEKFNQTTHIQYQPWKSGPWLGFNWRYDSGLVAGSIPCFAPTATCFGSTPIPIGGAMNIPNRPSGVREQHHGLASDCRPGVSVGAHLRRQTGCAESLGAALAICDEAGWARSMSRFRLRAQKTTTTIRSALRRDNLFDLSVGDDNLLHGDRYKWSLRLTAINLTNKVALYNFFSTFSGTHYVTPRALTAELGFHF